MAALRTRRPRCLSLLTILAVLSVRAHAFSSADYSTTLYDSQPSPPGFQGDLVLSYATLVSRFNGVPYGFQKLDLDPSAATSLGLRYTTKLTGTDRALAFWIRPDFV